jgi:hypothetical protein
VTAITDEEQLSISITSYRNHVNLAVAAVAPLNSWTGSISAELAALRAGTR